MQRRSGVHVSRCRPVCPVVLLEVTAPQSPRGQAAGARWSLGLPWVRSLPDFLPAPFRGVMGVMFQGRRGALPGALDPGQPEDAAESESWLWGPFSVCLKVPWGIVTRSQVNQREAPVLQMRKLRPRGSKDLPKIARR